VLKLSRFPIMYTMYGFSSVPIHSFPGQRSTQPTLDDFRRPGNMLASYQDPRALTFCEKYTIGSSLRFGSR